MKKADKSGLINRISILIILASIGYIIYVFTLDPKPRSRIDQSIYDAFSGICASEKGAVEEASLFAGGPSGPVPTVLLNVDGSPYGSSKGFGKGWIPNSVSEVQLVVCVGDDTSMDRDCPGQLRLLGLMGRHVSVIEAKSGIEVYGFPIYKAYSCPGPDPLHEEYSVDAIRIKLEEALSSGKITVPNPRIFHAADILPNPQGKSTYVHVVAHRFQNGDRLRLGISGCRIDEMGTFITSKYYDVDWVDEDTLQLLSTADGAPVELTNFNTNCTGILTRE